MMVGVVQALSNPLHPAARLISGWNGKTKRDHPSVTVYRPKQVQRRLDPVTIEELVVRYQAGGKILELADEFGINRTTVHGHLDRSGVERRQKRLHPNQVPEAARLYGLGMSLREVGQQFGVDGETVRQTFKKQCVPVRHRGGRTKRPTI